ncbi:hypothetical protein GEMRC1_004044 [Eukaryota sp. GEM-RC1]
MPSQFALLSEHLRALGYSDALIIFLSKRLDPTSSIPDDIDNETDRLFFIKSFVQLASSVARIKLNPKKLYTANLDSIAELLKLSTVCYDALLSSYSPTLSNPSELIKDLNSKLDALKLLSLKSVSVDGPPKAVKLMSLLDNEEVNLSKRAVVLERNIDVTVAEQVVKNMTTNVTHNITQTQKSLGSVQKDVEQLDTKIKSRQNELSRSLKRLEGLKTVRPSFMDDFEKIEDEIRHNYDQYVTMFRNFHYYDVVYESLIAEENEKLSSQLKKLKKLKIMHRQENLRHLRENNDSDDSDPITSSSEQQEFDDAIPDDDEEGSDGMQEFETKVQDNMNLLNNDAFSSSDPDSDLSPDLGGSFDQSDSDVEFLGDDNDDDAYLLGDSLDEGL